MYHVSAQGVDGRMINVHHYYYAENIIFNTYPTKNCGTIAPTEVKHFFQIGYSPEIQGKQHGKEP